MIKDLLAKLDKETSLLSSPQMMERTPSFFAIKKIGNDAIPELLQALRDDQAVHPVMILLAQITGEWPVKPEEAGNVDKMVAAWLQWGETIKV